MDLRSKIIAGLVFLIIPIALFAQSGRIKPTETPSPKPKQQDGVIYVPTQDNRGTPKQTPTPTPTPKKKIEDDDDVIRVDSTLVPIPVSITDATGRAVTNLRLEDFELSIDGKAAKIDELSRSQLPVKLAMLFDNSSSVTIAREFETKAAIRFFKQVIRPEKDQAALFSVASVSRLEQPLTKNVSQLIRAIESFQQPGGGTALLDGIISAANYLRDYDGRRVIVIVSDGDDTLSDSTFEQTMMTVLSASCQVYVVKTTDFENLIRTGTRGGNANIRSLSAERRMQDLTGQTGGAVYSPIDEKELNQAFARISAELSEQYILNYYPEEESAGGELRTITVSVKNKNDLTVRARKGYYVPKKPKR